MSGVISRNLWIVGLVGLLAICAAVVLQATNPALPQIVKSSSVLFFSSLGSTLFTVAIVASVVDRGLRKQQSEDIKADVERIKRNVFRAVYKRDIPEDVVRSLSDGVLTAGFIRRGYRVDQTIEVCRNSNDAPYVKCACVVEYHVKNTTLDEREYEVLLEFREQKDPELASAAEYHSLSFSSGEEYNTETLERDHRNDQTNKPGFRRYSVSTNLAPSQEKYVYMSWTEVHEMDDHIAWFALDLSHDFTINLKTAPSGSFQDKWYDIYPLHPYAGTPIQNGNGTMFARIDTVVLPYQGFIVWWKFNGKQHST